MRQRAFWIAVGLVVVSIVGLIVLYRFQPSADPAIAAKETGKLDLGLFGTVQTILATALSIGALSLIFDLLLRESYGHSLRRFLNLKTALVRSGLSDSASAASTTSSR